MPTLAKKKASAKTLTSKRSTSLADTPKRTAKKNTTTQTVKTTTNGAGAVVKDSFYERNKEFFGSLHLGDPTLSSKEL